MTEEDPAVIRRRGHMVRPECRLVVEHEPPLVEVVHAKSATARQFALQIRHRCARPQPLLQGSGQVSPGNPATRGTMQHRRYPISRQLEQWLIDEAVDMHPAEHVALPIEHMSPVRLAPGDELGMDTGNMLADIRRPVLIVTPRVGQLRYYLSLDIEDIELFGAAVASGNDHETRFRVECRIVEVRDVEITVSARYVKPPKASAGKLAGPWCSPNWRFLPLGHGCIRLSAPHSTQLASYQITGNRRIGALAARDRRLSKFSCGARGHHQATPRTSDIT